MKDLRVDRTLWNNKCNGRKPTWSPIDITHGPTHPEGGCLDQRRPTAHVSTCSMVMSSKRCRRGFVSDRKASFSKWWRSSLNNTRSGSLCRGTMPKSNMCICSPSVELKLLSQNCLYFLIHPPILKYSIKMKISVFQNTTMCCPLKSTNASEEHVASIFIWHCHSLCCFILR
jgi:hypothetical protein